MLDRAVCGRRRLLEMQEEKFHRAPGRQGAMPVQEKHSRKRQWHRHQRVLDKGHIVGNDSKRGCRLGKGRDDGGVGGGQVRTVLVARRRNLHIFLLDK